MILDDILNHKRDELAARKREAPLAAVRARCRDAAPARGFAEALSLPGLSIIAEVKRRSPAKGVLNQAVDPAAQAAAYEQAGARAVSVLTDERFFGGSNADLESVKARVGLPILRKDFTIDAYQVYEARSLGADAILLIVRALEPAQLTDFQSLAHELGMGALVEVHNEAELERAAACGAAIIGVNNRDLATMTVDIRTTARLRPLVPDASVFVSESGIRTPDDVRAVSAAGVDAILVGEALMASRDPRATLHAFLEAATEVHA